MGIYILDTNSQKIAEYLDDRSLERMIKDIAQVLCNVHWETKPCLNCDKGNEYCECTCMDNDKAPLKYTKECEWSHWARESKANYEWLVGLLLRLKFEYQYRFNKAHPMLNMISWARDNVPDLPEYEIEQVGYDSYGETVTETRELYSTPFPLVMPKRHITIRSISRQGTPDYPEHIIESYRNYYQAKLKAPISFYKWTNQQKPDWINLT